MSSQTATRTANSRSNPITKASELKKTQSTHKEPNGSAATTTKAATPEQIRINSITNVNRSDDPEIVKKIRQVQDIVGEELQSRDDIALALHQNDYDLDRTVNFLLEGGRVDEDWITAGTTRKKPTTTTESSEQQQTATATVDSGEHQTNGRKRNPNNRRSRGETNGERPKNNKTRNGGDQQHSVRAIEDRFTTSLDLKDSEEQNQTNGEDSTNNRVNNRPQRGPRGVPRNNGTDDDNNNNRRTKSGGRQHNGTVNNTNGPYRKTDRPSGGPRLSNENRRSTGTYNKVVNGANQENTSEFVSETKTTTINTEIAAVVATVPNTSSATSTQPALNTVSPSIAAVVAGSLSSDNFRHMGTWSNENNDSNRNRRMMNRNGPPTSGGNRFNNQRQQGNQSNKLEVDEWDNEEEWQGDLTKPQIFTSSAQQKKETESAPPVQQIAQQQQATNRSDFTIDHFNAEEAAQKIKKAVGIGGPSTNGPVESINKPPTNPAQQQQQQQPVVAAAAKSVVPKMPSVKPPPPSTKIPKSAVIMPDGTTSTSSVSYLDVQFGVDFDTPSFKSTQSESKPPVVSQPTTSQVKPQQNQFPSAQISATSNTQTSVAPSPAVSQSKPQTNISNKDNFVNKIDQLSSIKQSSSSQQQSNKPPMPISDKSSSGFPSHTPATNLNALKSNILQQQQRQFNQLNQLNNKDNVNAAHLNISPQNNVNKQSNNNTQQQQQQQQVLNQLQQSLNQQSLVNSNQSSSNNSTNNMIAAAAAAVASKQNPAALAPPPGVNMVNPNNQYLIGFPFNQNFPYFDQSQIDSSLMQVYNHLTTGAMPPPGVGNSTAPPSAAQYSNSENKFPRNDSATLNNQLNLNPTATSQLSAAGQQQPINLIPNLNNFPFFFPNYPYPNLYLPMHNGNQAANQQQFQNKQPGYNFTNNGDYEQAAKDYGSYNAPSQMKTSSSNLSNVSDLTYSKSVEKSSQQQQAAANYHTSTPPNFANSLLNQPPIPAPSGSSAATGPAQFAYMIGTPSGAGPSANMIHPGIQDNLNSRNIGNNSNNLKNMSKSSYQNNSWGQ